MPLTSPPKDEVVFESNVIEKEDTEEKKPFIPPPPPRKAMPKQPEKNVLSSEEMNELKREVKRISNRRAMAIANRLSGDGQDESLKNWESQVRKIENELDRLRLRAMPNSSILVSANGDKKMSSLLVDRGQLMPAEKLRVRLETMKNEIKDQVSHVMSNNMCCICDRCLIIFFPLLCI